MKARGETVCERGDRSRRSQNFNLDALWSFSRWSPSVECEELQMVAGDEVGLVGRRIDDDRSRRKSIDKTGPENPVSSPDESTTAAIPFGSDSLVELRCQDGTTGG